MLRQTAEMDVSELREFPTITHQDVFWAVFKILLTRVETGQSGRDKGKWRENVDHEPLFSGDRRARWKIVIGGKSFVHFFHTAE